ncbi:BTAD domain-containing putative transcriptional regulator, partial [Streptomyces sp. NPDC000658]|uniref:AfsR/SARP family transcriptional regulator n=1 Tax=Streptomyces sp. NPDC000658 TaxID=3154266 RepID=UPI00332A72D6
MGGVMRRYGLRFGLLGPPVLYRADRAEAAAESGVEPEPEPILTPEPEPFLTPEPEPDSELASASGARAGSAPSVQPGTGAPSESDRCARAGYETVRSPKARALLAALLLEAGRTVPVESLKEALWGGAPPASAQASLHNHVTRLRRLLDDPGRLRAVGSGYQLRVEQGELDVHVFERHVAAARGAHAARNGERVLRECAAALALWRGDPLSGLPAELGGYAFVRRLRESRLLLLEWRHDAELALGDGRFEHRLPELTALAAEHPLRESFHRQLMLALHRTGRQAEALAVHRDLRTRLVEELGVEPGPAVREAHVEVLGPTTDPLAVPPATSVLASAAPSIAAPASTEPSATEPSATEPFTVVTPASVPPSAAASAAPSPTSSPSASAAERASAVRSVRHPRPAQLPPPPAHFTGRLETLRRLRRTLASDPSGPAGLGENLGRDLDEGRGEGLDEGRGEGLNGGLGGGRGPAVVVLSGTAGVGKSALALQVAHALRERFPDGQLYLHLHGATPGVTPLTAGQALTALLRDLGVAPRHIPEHPDAGAALLRTVLAPTRTLVVLDDAATAAQVRPLLPAGAACAVIVTSRSPLTALDGAHRFPLVPLSGEDSAALLRAASGPGEGRAELGAGHPLVGLTGRLPLALRVVAARLAARSALTPDMLARQLAEAESRLTHLEYDDLSVRRSLAVAHDALAVSEREADRDAALVLRRIGALDLPAYGVPLLARLIGADESRAEAALDRLVDVALLEELAYGRYTPHDLVRDFARELAAADTATHSTADAASTPTASTPTASTPTASTPTASTPTASTPTASTPTA